MGRGRPARAEMREEVDEVVLAFRVARRAAAGVKETSPKPSWLRMVWQATGIPVERLAQQLEVTKHEVFQLEKAEREGRIVLRTLKGAAEALGCELVYGLAPKEGSLEDLGARAEREKKFAEARELEARIIKDDRIEDRVRPVGDANDPDDISEGGVASAVRSFVLREWSVKKRLREAGAEVDDADVPRFKKLGDLSSF